MTQPSKIVRTRQLQTRLGISRATLHRWERAGRLPPKRKLGPNAVGWLESEIEAWLAELPEARPRPGQGGSPSEGLS